MLSSHMPLSLLCWVLLSFFLSPALAAEKSPPPATATPTAATASIFDQTSLDQTSRALDLEESGYSSITDTSGQSARHKKLLSLLDGYRRHLQKNPQEVQTLLLLADVLEKLGDHDGARDIYRAVLDIDPDNNEALAKLKKTHPKIRPQVTIYRSELLSHDYLPVLGTKIATWRETTTQTSVSAQLAPGKTISLGWLDGHIKQENNFFGDIDFDLKRQGPFFHLGISWSRSLQTDVRVRDEKFTNASQDGFYRTNGNTHIVTGYAALMYVGKEFWTTMNYSREREPDPVYDNVNFRSSLNIRVKELAGVAVGKMIARGWEAGGSLYKEQYGSGRPGQWNLNGQVIHRSASLPGAQISLGSGYYTEERETIMNLTANYRWHPFAAMNLRLEYQLEYSRNNDSWLNEGSVLCRWTLAPQVFLDAKARYGKEIGGDRDDELFLQAALSILVF